MVGPGQMFEEKLYAAVVLLVRVSVVSFAFPKSSHFQDADGTPVMFPLGFNVVPETAVNLPRWAWSLIV